MTIREQVLTVQKQLGNSAVTPDTVRMGLMTLTSLLWHVQKEQREADHEYKLVLLGCLQGDEAANRARIRAEVTPQHQRAQEAKHIGEFVIETIRSCKVYLKSLDEELRLSR